MHILLDNRQLPIYYEDNLRGNFLGDWQGKTVEDIMITHRLDYELYTDYQDNSSQPIRKALVW